MKQNRSIESAWRYHNLTKHSYQSIRADRHYLDWANQPSPFKIYPTLEPLALPRSLVQTIAPAIDAVSSIGVEFEGEQKLDLARLASILYYSAGVTKHKSYPGGELYFRAAACAGALYPIETYVVCGELEGLEAGVYHFNPGDFSLRKLRDGDLRGVLTEATGNEPRVAGAPVTLLFTAISWRSTWKYRDRAYRYHFWDNGMILANALAMAAAHELPAEVLMGFVETQINKLIGIDGREELALSMLALGHTEPRATGITIEDLHDINFEVLPLSASPVAYDSICEMHFASSLTDSGEVRGWRSATLKPAAHESEVERIALTSAPMPSAPIEDVIQRRASTRRFARKPLPLSELMTIIDRSTRRIQFDLESSELNDLYAIVNDVEGLPSGAYFYRRSDRALELLNPGEFRQKAAYLALGQDLGGDASVTFFFMADLAELLNVYGNRGYRAAQLEAGIIGGKMYLASYALNRGATGLTFYDDDVSTFFSPHAMGKSCIFVVSVGIPGKRTLL